MLNKNNLSIKTLLATVLSILILAPFQGLILMWFTSMFGHQLIWQVLKEVILLIAVGATCVILSKNKNIFRNFIKDKLVNVTLIYIILSIVLALANISERSASVAGLILDIRFFVFFLITMVLGSVYKENIIKKASKVVLIVALVVSIFAVLQMTILPAEFLGHFGFNGKPIPASFTIDSDQNALRVASTTRGPNNLGAYLIVPLSILGALIYSKTAKYLRKKNNTDTRTQILLIGGFLLGCAALYGSHSRSAILGFILSVSLCTLFCIESKYRKYVVAVGSVLGVVVLCGAIAMRNTQVFKTVVLHDSPGVGGIATSNQGHLSAVKSGIEDVIDSKFVGCGPGCAGPASYRHTGGPKVAENYYIQVAQEAGLAGFISFTAISVIVCIRLYKLRKTEIIAMPLLSAFAGLFLVNMLLHSWADDSLAYVWWGLAGLVIGSYSHLGSETASAKHLRTSEKVSTGPSS